VSAPDIGVGMLGYAFMGKAHTHAYRTLSYMTWPPPLVPRLVRIAGRDAEAVAEAARRYGFDDHATDWRELVADERVELFDNVAPNRLHAEPTIAAAEAGKHVVCEKPLGMTADESYEIWQRVAAAGVRHMCAFNYRFVPAVRLAREMLEAGDLGDIRHFRASYLQSWLATTCSPPSVTTATSSPTGPACVTATAPRRLPTAWCARPRRAPASSCPTARPAPRSA
jgi:predicted dehydrogenase